MELAFRVAISRKKVPPKSRNQISRGLVVVAAAVPTIMTTAIEEELRLSSRGGDTASVYILAERRAG